jgi:Tripartite tricarboxylate transporter TctB family
MGARDETVRIVSELAFWLALAAIGYALSFEFADEPGTYLWGAASWPRGVLLLMALGALAQAAVRMYRQKLTIATDAPARETPAAADKPEAVNRLKFLATFALPLIYVALLPHAGFYVTTPFFLAAYLLLLGERRPLVLIVAPLVIYALINLVFTKLFYVALPTGNWPGFYDFSNWFLVTVR